jgi:hypothetical protein
MKSGFRKEAILVSLAIGLTVSVGAGLWAGGARSDDAAALTIEDVEAGMINADPGHFMETLKLAFPDDYRNMLEQVLAAVKSGAGGDEIRRLTASLTSDIRHRNAANVTSASLSKLDLMVAAQGAFIQVIQARNAAACARYVVKGPSDELAKLMTDTDVVKAATAFASATFEAIVDGKGKPRPIRWRAQTWRRFLPD